MPPTENPHTGHWPPRSPHTESLPAATTTLATTSTPDNVHLVLQPRPRVRCLSHIVQDATPPPQLHLKPHHRLTTPGATASTMSKTSASMLKTTLTRRRLLGYNKDKQETTPTRTSSMTMTSSCQSPKGSSTFPPNPSAVELPSLSHNSWNL